MRIPIGGSITHTQQAALHTLVTLVEAIYDKMDMIPSPLQPFVTDLVRRRHTCVTDNTALPWQGEGYILYCDD